MDYKWFESKNGLQFFNAFKMKMAIILGVSHMLLGIVLKAANSLHFGNMIDLLFEFIP